MDTNGDIKLKWSTQKRRVDDLIPFKDNPRQMTDKQREDLKKSLEKFDLAEIPAINTDNKICAGHQRMKYLQLVGRGQEVIDVRVPNRKLTDAEFREYNLRSNKNRGEWKYDSLHINFDDDLLARVGFEDEELEKRILGDFDDDKVDFGYKFGTINSWVRIGDITTEISDEDYNVLKRHIEEAGGIKNFLSKIIKQNGEIDK